MMRVSTVAASVTLCIVVHWGTQGGRAQDSERREVPAVETHAEKAARLIKAYPDQLDRLDGGTLVWKDGTRMVFDDGRTDKAFDMILDAPDIEDQLAMRYPLEFPQLPPPKNFDPGRFRNAEFFLKMYGDCSRGEVARKLATVPWLPKSGGGTLQITSVNRVDERLRAVSEELDELPSDFKRFLVPAAGGYVCRTIAGSANRSAHGFGIAVDINPAQGDYWFWRTKTDYEYRNRVPADIVQIFEKHGFIWGGKWYHYDTMHFEYRPELLDLSQ